MNAPPRACHIRPIVRSTGVLVGEIKADRVRSIPTSDVVSVTSSSSGTLAVQLGEELDRSAGGDPGAETPPDAVPEGEAVRLTADEDAAESREFHSLLEVLADDEVDHHVGLTGAPADVLVAGRHLDGGTDGQRGRLLPVLGGDVELRPDDHVADTVVVPEIRDERVLVQDAAVVGISGVEQRPCDAFEPRVGADRPEELDTVADADANGADEVADVRQALFTVEVGAIAADRPLAGRQDLPGGYEPQPGVSEPRGAARLGVGIVILRGRHDAGDEPDTGCQRC